MWDFVVDMQFAGIIETLCKQLQCNPLSSEAGLLRGPVSLSVTDQSLKYVIYIKHETVDIQGAKMIRITAKEKNVNQLL